MRPVMISATWKSIPSVGDCRQICERLRQPAAAATPNTIESCCDMTRWSSPNCAGRIDVGEGQRRQRGELHRAGRAGDEQDRDDRR